MCLFDLYLAGWGGWVVIAIVCTLEGIVVGKFKCGKMAWPSKKFFINNSVEDLIPFNEEHQGLLKLHVPLGWEWGVRVWGGGRGEWSYLQKRKFSLRRKNKMWGGFSESTEILLSLESVWRVLVKEKWGGNRKRFYSEIWRNVAWGRLAKVL